MIGRGYKERQLQYRAERGEIEQNKDKIVDLSLFVKQNIINIFYMKVFSTSCNYQTFMFRCACKGMAVYRKVETRHALSLHV